MTPQGQARRMTPRRFAWALRAQGADLSAWPTRDRADALMLLRSDEGSQALLADMLASEGDDPGPDMAGLCRMQAVIRAALAPATTLVRVLRWAALAACVVAGAYLGTMTAMESEPAVGPEPTIEASSPATVLAALDP